MKMKLLRVAVLAVTPVALSACSYLGAQFTNDKVQYESSNSRAPLEVPPDLSQVPHDNLRVSRPRPRTAPLPLSRLCSPKP